MSFWHNMQILSVARNMCVCGHGSICRCLPVSLTQWARAYGWWLIPDRPRFIVLRTKQLRRQRDNSWCRLMVGMKINEDRRSRGYREGWMLMQGCIFSLSYVWDHVFLGEGECKVLPKPLECVECVECWVDNMSEHHGHHVYSIYGLKSGTASL